MLRNLQRIASPANLQALLELPVTCTTSLFKRTLERHSFTCIGLSNALIDSRRPAQRAHMALRLCWSPLAWFLVACSAGLAGSQNLAESSRPFPGFAGSEPDGAPSPVDTASHAASVLSHTAHIGPSALKCFTSMLPRACRLTIGLPHVSGALPSAQTPQLGPSMSAAPIEVNAGHTPGRGVFCKAMSFAQPEWQRNENS